MVIFEPLTYLKQQCLKGGAQADAFARWGSKGIVEITFSPEVKKIPLSYFQTAQKNGGIHIILGKEYYVKKVLNKTNTEYYAYEVYNTETVLNEAYKIATSWGANALTSLEISRTNLNTSFPSLTITGFAIKYD